MQQNEIANELIRCLAVAGLPAKLGKPAQIGSQTTWHEITADDLPLCRLVLLPSGMVGIHSYRAGFYFECEPSELPTAANAIAGIGPRDWRQFGFSKLECRSNR